MDNTSFGSAKDTIFRDIIYLKILNIFSIARGFPLSLFLGLKPCNKIFSLGLLMASFVHVRITSTSFLSSFRQLVL